MKLNNESIKILKILCIIFALIAVVVPNIEWIKSPITPQLEVRLVDYLTNKPISGMNIVVRWSVINTYFPDQVRGSYSDIIIVKTDKNGVLKINRKLKPLSLILFPFYQHKYNGINVFTINNDYEFIAHSIYAISKAEIKAIPIKNKSKLIDNIEAYNYWIDKINDIYIKNVLIEYRDAANKMVMNR